MKLTCSQLRPLIKGAAVVKENADGSAYLRRMTDSQQAIYEGSDHYFTCEMAAGMALDFYTDAQFLSLTLTGQRTGSRKTTNLDLLVDGKLAKSQICWLSEGAEKGVVNSYGTHTFLFPLQPGEKRLTVYFNCFCSVDGVTVELSDGAAFRPYMHKRKLLAFGDSITQGHTAAYPSRTYMAQTGRRLDAEVYNFGISGERFEEAKIVPGTYPQCDLVTVAYGTNDFGHKKASEALFFKNMPAFLAKAAKEFPHVPVFVLLPLWRADCGDIYNSVGSLSSVRERIAAEAAKYGNFHVIDCQNFIPQDPKYFADLRLHPNDKGMEEYAEGVSEAILKILNASNS